MSRSNIQYECAYLSKLFSNNLNKDTVSTYVTAGFAPTTQNIKTIKCGDKEHKFTLVLTGWDVKGPFNFQVIKGQYSKTLQALGFLKDQSYLEEFDDLVSTIKKGSNLTSSQIDKLIVLNRCDIFIDNLNLDGMLEQCEVVKNIIIQEKTKRLLELSDQFENETLPLQLDTNSIDRYTKITHTHTTLMLDSPNVVWSGSSVHDLIYRSDNLETLSTKLIDLDLFIIGSQKEKSKIIKQIVQNLITKFGAQNVLYGYSRSVCNVWIRGINRIVQLISWGSEQTKPNDVIKHFDLDYLKNRIFVQSNSGPYQNQINYKYVSLPEAIKSNQIKVIQYNPSLKGYRLEKAEARGFKIMNGKSRQTPPSFPYDDYMRRKARFTQELWDRTTNLTLDYDSIKSDLEILNKCEVLEGPSSLSKLEQMDFSSAGSDKFSGYANQINFPNDKLVIVNDIHKPEKTSKLYHKPEIFGTINIMVRAKLLHIAKYGIDTYITYSCIYEFDSDDKYAIFALEKFYNECVLKSKKAGFEHINSRIIGIKGIYIKSKESIPDSRTDSEQFLSSFAEQSNAIVVDCRAEGNLLGSQNVGSSYLVHLKFNCYVCANICGISCKAIC